MIPNGVAPLELESEDRKRIAREIHDDLGQSLVGVRLELMSLVRRLSAEREPLPPGAMLERCTAIVEAVDGAIASMRRVLDDLRAGTPERIDVHAALVGRAQWLHHQTGIRVDVDVSSRHESISAERGFALSKIAQEVLTNVARHARAQRVVLRLEVDAREVVLSIADDGCGFDPSDGVRRDAFGLAGVRERAARLGGAVRIESRPAVLGTRVVVQLPILA